MRRMAPHLYQDYLRFKEMIPEHVFAPPLLGYDEVLKAHYLICDYFESKQGISSVYGVRSMQLLGSALGRQITCFAGENKWKNDFEIMASLFFGLVKNHPFQDGNKRTALLVLLYNLFLFKRVPKTKCRQSEWERLTVSVAASDMSQYSNFHIFEKRANNKEDAIVYFVASFLKSNTRITDKFFVSMTYADFEASIKPFGFYFANPSKNYIDIRKTEIKHVLGFSVKFDRRIKNIAFPGYRCQMDSKTQKSILKDIGLTIEKGYDRQVLNAKADPLNKIIQDYEVPLSRLKDQ